MTIWKSNNSAETGLQVGLEITQRTCALYYTENAYYRDPARPDGIKGVEFLPYFEKLLAKNPDWTWDAMEIFPITRGFCVKWKASIPVGTKIIQETGMDIVELDGGKISRNEVWFDRSNLFAASQGLNKI